MTTTNGQVRSAVEELREVRAQVHLARAKRDLAVYEKRAKQIQEANLLWDWMSGYQDLLDRLRTDEGRVLLAPSTVTDRRYGANWPHWRTWQEHALLRAQSRILCTVGDLANGILGGLASYVIGDGLTYRVSPRPKRQPPPALVDVCQEFVDDWCDCNDTFSLDLELFKRRRRDGEHFVRDYEQDDGMTLLRVVEPEQVMDPTGAIPYERGSFGVITEEGDVQRPVSYWVTYTGQVSDGEEVPATVLQHSKINVDCTVKRGMPDFVYDVYDGLKQAGRSTQNMIESAAVQAAVTEIRQWETATQTQVQSFADAEADYDGTNTLTGGRIPTKQVRSGSTRDIPKGMTYVPPPFSSGGPVWIQVVQATLRRVGVRWNAPEWLVSGDASNNNFASALVAEAPFARRVKRWGKHACRLSRANAVRALRNACCAGRIRAEGRTWTWEEVRRVLDILVEAPQVQSQDPLQQAQEASVYVQIGATSPQIVAAKIGNDYEQVARDLEEHAERFGGGGGVDPADVDLGLGGA